VLQRMSPLMVQSGLQSSITFDPRNVWGVLNQRSFLREDRRVDF
jgi:hypothetical protein